MSSPTTYTPTLLKVVGASFKEFKSLSFLKEEGSYFKQQPLRAAEQGEKKMERVLAAFVAVGCCVIAGIAAYTIFTAPLPEMKLVAGAICRTALFVGYVAVIGALDL